jgi:type I restriction enzyme R subunit
VSITDIEGLPAGSLQRLQCIDDAVNELVAPDDVRREFFGHERLVVTLFQAVKPHPAALQFDGTVKCIATIADAIRAKLHSGTADISKVMGGINSVLDESIIGVGVQEHGRQPLDLSKTDFEKLSNRFKESQAKNTDLEVLKAATRAQLERYNAGSSTIDSLFEELLRFTNTLTDEQRRHIREMLSEEELYKQRGGRESIEASVLSASRETSADIGINAD